MRKARSLIAIVIVALLVLGMVAGIIVSFDANAKSDSVADMQDELDDIAKEKEALEKELDEIADHKEETLAQKEIIDQQIDELEQEAQLLEGIVGELNVQLEESRGKLATAESELSENTRLAKERIRAMYELGGTSYFEIILNSSSLHDFISRIEIVKQMSAYDKQVIDNLKNTKETIETETNAIEEKTKKQQKALSDMESNVSALESKQAQSDALIKKFNEQTAENLKALEKAEAEQAKLRAEIDKAIANSGKQDFVGGEFLWPVPGYYGITSQFGYRYHPISGKYKYHNGTDISGSGISGKPILAVNSGTVLIAGYNSGYGNYVVIDHGGGITSLYAHAKSLNVRAGQNVSRGDTVAYVGSTGYSTGPHLHLEFTKNGQRVDPLDYYSHISFRYY